MTRHDPARWIEHDGRRHHDVSTVITGGAVACASDPVLLAAMVREVLR